MTDVAIIGGGLAGLSAAITLSKAGKDVTLIEKKTYPYHKVCGEYVSNETLPFLIWLGFDPSAFNASKITRFLLSAQTGKTLEADLDLGGFGLSRYVFDHELCKIARRNNVKVLEKTTVTDTVFKDDRFFLSLTSGDTIEAKVVIGSYGKRSNIDRILERDFFQKNSPFIGVKYHMKLNFDKDVVALHNFRNGYCGVVKIEDDRYNVCYLAHRNLLKESGSIEAMEKEILYKNPHIKGIFTEGEQIYDKPEVINEISFETKTPVEDRILMAGDAAGMITPLCGNGMAMALHSGKIAAETVIDYFEKQQTRQVLEQNYSRNWKKRFANRLRNGRIIQQLFGKPLISNAVIYSAAAVPSFFISPVIKATHGDPF